MTNHKHIFTKCGRCDICGVSLQRIVEEKNSMNEFANIDTIGKPSTQDWDKA